MDYSFDTDASSSPYVQLLKVATLIPISHYLLGFLFILSTFLYHFLEIHFFQDFFTGFRGQAVVLTYDSCSQLYQEVASKCQVLHERYLATPWLSSPHFQTVYLSFFGKAPPLKYKRELFRTPDGGTIALDWAMNPEGFQENAGVQKDDKDPIVVVVPGLTSDSDASYVKHLAFKIVKRGWNVVVSNHRGLGGISITSDCFYNGGWTQDIRKVVNHLHHRYPEAPLFVVGTSLGANIVVKYLGEDGDDIPISGAAAICSPYDLLLADRFLNRGIVQKFYDKVLTLGLKDFAQLHEPVLSRLADWEGIMKSRSVRDFDNYATRIVGKFVTVDTFYRRCSSCGYVCDVQVPLLCINALDDPVCTGESIPWDECRTNKNIILATTQHGGHLAYFEGINAKSLWWVRAVDEFLSILQSSPLMHKKNKVEVSPQISPSESSMDQGPYLNIVDDGLVAAVGSDPTAVMENLHNQQVVLSDHNEGSSSNIQMDGQKEKTNSPNENVQPQGQGVKNLVLSDNNEELSSNNQMDDQKEKEKTNSPNDNNQPQGKGVKSLVVPIRKCLNQLSRQSRKSIRVLAYIALITSWPLMGSAFRFLFNKKFRNALQISKKR